ncbi:PREDICTED: uncharacterized protein LOC105626151 [Atta cephalotes]|uniref:Uncharacterized protein n=1 Tax=Atta cephalotes TaxID=12957 RepID=A0A158NZ95_ATTCE|nr:PREDICTED: uncharacterized protein LOC105626151 [Atta cephalotes]
MFEDSSGRGFCAKKYIISAYKKIIHGGIIFPRLFQENGMSEFGGIPLGELTHNFVTSASSAASNLRTVFDDLRARMGDTLSKRINMNNIPEDSILYRIMHTLPNIAHPAPIGPSRIISPRPIGIDDYKGIGVASAGAASSAASRKLAKYSSMY